MSYSIEDQGKIISIRPQQPIVVDRIEKDVRKLKDLYEEGYTCAEKMLREHAVTNDYLGSTVAYNFGSSSLTCGGDSTSSYSGSLSSSSSSMGSGF